MFKSCTHCKNNFEITDDDLKFYDKISPVFNGKKYLIPAPNSCPECRLTRRLQERNARKLYKRKCSFSGEEIISQYHEKHPFPVYKEDIWWSDKWEALDYGRDFDFNKKFFKQFQELKNVVPHMSVFICGGTLQNSDYTNCTGYLKNCYLIFESDYDEDCYYSNLLKNSKNLVDCSICYDSELCYECVDCSNAYNLKYSQNCQNCQDSWFLKNCIGSQDCISSANQIHKQYVIFNKQYSKDEYKKLKIEFALDTHSGIQNLLTKSYEFFTSQIYKNLQGENNQNSLGDNLYNCKDSQNCFDSKNLEDCKYCAKLSLNVKSCMDYNSWGDKAELVYECSACGDNIYNIAFCSTCTSNLNNCYYCDQCSRCSYLFGCVGLKDKKYCVFNKQYSKEEYEELVPRIIDHMNTCRDKTCLVSTGEWGEFFPSYISPFGYNETIAMDYFPLTKKDVETKDFLSLQGFKWCDFENPLPVVEKIIPANLLPNTISEIPDDILNWAVECEITKKPFKIIKPELDFYRKMNLPIPHLHPDERHKIRMAKRNPRTLFDRNCMKCNAEIKTTYAPDRPEIVYCEKCYLEAIY